jgi:hypothetical protein
MGTNPRDRLLRLADECVALSAKTGDVGTASELLKISGRILQLADPVMAGREDNIAEFSRRQMFGAA